MAIPIRISSEALEQLCAEFKEELQKDLINGKINFSRTLQVKEPKKIHVLMTPEAFVKQQSLVSSNPKEVSWHGVVDRVDDDTFIISDILLHPQEVGSSKVDTTDEDYTAWMIEILKAPNNLFERLRCHGHSHVNMGTSPSSTDTEYQKMVMKDIAEDGFNIFMICNKKNDLWIRVYDKKNNVIYDQEDIIFDITMADSTLLEFIENSKEYITKKKITYQRHIGNKAFRKAQSSKNDDEDSVFDKYLTGEDKHYGNY